MILTITLPPVMRSLHGGRQGEISTLRSVLRGVAPAMRVMRMMIMKLKRKWKRMMIDQRAWQSVHLVRLLFPAVKVCLQWNILLLFSNICTFFIPFQSSLYWITGLRRLVILIMGSMHPVLSTFHIHLHLLSLSFFHMAWPSPLTIFNLVYIAWILFLSW